MPPGAIMHKWLTGPLSVEQLTVPIRDLPVHLSGVRLTQLTDFHYDGLCLSDWLLQEAIAASNAANPDLVVLTGDYVTDAPEWIHALVPWLKRLQSRYGVYAVLGNHDNYRRRSRHKITHALTNAGIHVLWNQIAYPFGTDLPLVGLSDYWTPGFQPDPVMQQLAPSTPRIVLSHNPDSATALHSWRVDLQLSGHSHGGQIFLPGIGLLPAKLAELYPQLPSSFRHHLPILRTCYRTVQTWAWAQGFHRVGKNALYVNRGLGSYPPGRLFCPPEVTVITLTRRSSQGGDA